MAPGTWGLTQKRRFSRENEPPCCRNQNGQPFAHPQAFSKTCKRPVASLPHVTFVLLPIEAAGLGFSPRNQTLLALVPTGSPDPCVSGFRGSHFLLLLFSWGGGVVLRPGPCTAWSHRLPRSSPGLTSDFPQRLGAGAPAAVCGGSLCPRAAAGGVVTSTTSWGPARWPQKWRADLCLSGACFDFQF
uniref:Uncharacterized protein n=1 Tax=Pipistrellus kuhlii TaxID=59472 RepID=A0A7J7V0H1_PIPKU|nr:hypothetical protein mPipKuh1_008669 [Pipistrellus kuhlii]